MSNPKILTAALVACAAVLPGVAGAGSAAPSAPAPTVDLVLSVDRTFSGALPAGTEVLDTYEGVGALLVRTPQDAVSWLAGQRGVRGVSADRRLSVAHHSAAHTGVLAPQALGAPAGTASAGSGVTVAVVDTGVADTAVLRRSSGRLVTGVNTSGEQGGVRDGHGHGTFMAGLIAGGSNGGDQVGVAPAARVVDVKVAAADGTTSLSRVLDGLDWVVKHRSGHKIGVVSLSLSAPRPQQEYGRDPLTDAAEAVRAAGVAVVVAAGNDPSQVGNPGQSPLVMTVGAADTRAGAGSASTASFSGSAVVAGMPRPDLVAPGVSLLSTLPEGSLLAVNNPGAATGKGLYRGSGTSQATAVTAGAVAVFLSQHAAAAPTPDDVRASFANAARDLSGSADGAGLVQWPTKVVRWSAESAGKGASTGSGDPTWSASSWSASSWSASSWSASSWSASSWSASSWSASSWSASSWSTWRQE